jgi:hypothetical protein
MKTFRLVSAAAAAACLLIGAMVYLEASAQQDLPETQEERDRLYDFEVYMFGCYNDGECVKARSKPIFDTLAQCEAVRDQIIEEMNRMRFSKGGFRPV